MRNVRTLFAVTAMAGLLIGCSKEIKPKEKGVFAVKGEQIVALQPVVVETEDTAEGFFLSYFDAEPKVGVTNGQFYLFFYGDFKPFGMRAFVRRNERYEEDTSKPSYGDVLQVGGMKGEDEMFKGTMLKALPPGIYVLDVQQKDGTQLHFAFQVQI